MPTKPHRTCTGICLLLCLCPFLAAQETQTGDLTLQFTETHPLSAYTEFEKRLRMRFKDLEPYRIADETFQVHVPAAGNTEAPYALLVSIDPGGRGRIPVQDYRKALAQRRMIWISADRCGNDRHVIQRLAIALDAVHNITQRYRVDPEQIFITGLSGGGRCASWLGFHFSDVFHGAMPICGVDYFAALAVPDQPNTFWPAKSRAPLGPLLIRAKRQTTYVLITGEKDGNRSQTRATAEVMKRQGFGQVHLIDEPGMEHTWPSPSVFGRGLDHLTQGHRQ